MLISLLYKIILDKRAEYGYGNYELIIDDIARDTDVDSDILLNLALNKESEARLSLKDIDNICRYFNITVDDLFLNILLSGEDGCNDDDENSYYSNRYKCDVHIDEDRNDKWGNLLIGATLSIGFVDIPAICSLSSDGFVELAPIQNLCVDDRNFLTVFLVNKELRETIEFELYNKLTNSAWYQYNSHYGEVAVSLYPYQCEENTLTSSWICIDNL